ncbi:hypothetical protein RC1_2521 [Rhodospirillum centenum SW]|uniref:Uncharacterized protein n=1 Tax=Rhodospirillum centenum (strain ATCC 51521 / SW) TaxID=414684 RepID=B6IU25_RHOCS|nr:hypothetical protein RC1_2521 [Rhodospirillum centenum SW]
MRGWNAVHGRPPSWSCVPLSAVPGITSRDRARRSASGSVFVFVFVSVFLLQVGGTPPAAARSDAGFR